MNDEQLLRYSRQILVPQIDIDGQTRLVNGRALIIGLGGLGSPIAMYMAAAGVGQLVVVDHDRVDLTNLQRQVIHATASIGTPKAASAAARIAALNPEVRVTAIGRKLTEEELLDEARAADVVLDATDNFATRLQVNRACVRAGTPLVWGAAIRMEGQVGVVLPARGDAPCYQCLYRDADYPSERCSQMGIFSPIVGVIGTLQANEALKVIMGIGEPLSGRLLLFDGLTAEMQVIRIAKNPACPTCAGAASVAAG